MNGKNNKIEFNYNRNINYDVNNEGKEDSEDKID